MQRVKTIHVVLLTILVVAPCLMFAYAFLGQTRISNFGRIKAVNVGVYEDLACMKPLNIIDWGMLEPNEAKTTSCFIRNEANVPVTLALTTENWIPLNASSFLFLGWDYAEEILTVNEVVEVVFSLSVSPDIEGIENFSFDIIVIGEG